MKSVRNVALTAVLTVSAFAAATFTSCKKSDDSLDRDKFIGKYAVVESCGGSYNTDVNAGSASTDVVFSNLGNFTTPAAVTGTVSGTALTITNFTDAQGRKFTGSGSYASSSSASVLTVNYTVIYTDNTSETCTAVMTKQ
ncbi:hypothetical protein ACTHGU_14070 [Chitinophagaceae bacterium MMS25-I14]